MGPLPGVCGTAHSFMQRGRRLEAVLEALAITAHATSDGVLLVMTPDAEVVGAPWPWSLGIGLGDGPVHYVTIDKEGETRLRLEGAAVGEEIALRVTQADLQKTKTVPLTRP